MVEQAMQPPLESEKIQPHIVKSEGKRAGDDCDADQQYYSVAEIPIQLTGLMGIPFSAR